MRWSPLIDIWIIFAGGIILGFSVGFTFAVFVR